MDYSNLLSQAQSYGNEEGSKREENENVASIKRGGETETGSLLESAGIPGALAIGAGLEKAGVSPSALTSTIKGVKTVYSAAKSALGEGGEVADYTNVVAPWADAGAAASTDTASAAVSAAADAATTAATGAAGAAADVAGAGADVAAATIGSTVGEAAAVLGPIGLLLGPLIGGLVELFKGHHDTGDPQAVDMSGVGVPTFTPGLS